MRYALCLRGLHKEFNHSFENLKKFIIDDIISNNNCFTRHFILVDNYLNNTSTKVILAYRN